MPENRILLVDDELPNLQKLRRTFINRYPVLTAGSGVEALGLIREHGDISVIIADQRMPDMTGVELLRRTLAPLPDAVRIILTGYTDADVLMEAINTCKVFRYLVKPWDPPDLLMTVERGLESRHLAVENARIRKELIRRERLAQELEIARDIQRYILPLSGPPLEGYTMAVEYHPAREVGGDLYDFDASSSDSTLQLIVGDVSGKSIPAALYGAVFSGQLRTLFANSMQPDEALAFLNANLVERYRVENFIAVAFLRLDLPTGVGSIANGGMPYPYIMHADGKVEQLSAAGVPLGLLEGSKYDQVPICLGKGDTLILSSDGTTDAMNPAGEIYDPQRFVESLRRHARENLGQCIRNAYLDTVRFTDGAEANDDVTIIGLRRLA